MAVALANGAPTPLYYRLFVILRTRILSGEIASGSMLPGEQELAAQYGVSRITAKRALDDLAAEGLVERRRGRGTTVTHEYAPAPVRAPLSGLLDSIEVMGARSTVRLVAIGREPVPPAVALHLSLRPGSGVLHARRVRSADGRPFALLDTYTAGPAAQPLEADGLAGTPRLELFRKAGIAIGRATQTLSATLADDETGPLLEVAAGTALLQLSRTLASEAGQPFDHLVARYVPGRFEYRMELTEPGPATKEAP